jgi:hypothetical protein
MVGRMLEIKVPYSREIQLDGEIYGHICPEYYFAQVQTQLEVCDMDECDFWQCRLEEYNDRNEFIKDTSPDCPFKSKNHGMEKGCIIQLSPKSMINEFNLFHSRYLYPTKINMTPKDCDEWIIENMNKIYDFIDENDDGIKGKYVFDKVIYWKLTRCNNVTIKRDMKWINDAFPVVIETWNYVEYYRKNKDKLEEFMDFVENCKGKRHKNDIVMEFANKQINNLPYKKPIKKAILDEEINKNDQGLFVSSDDEETNDDKKKGSKKKLAKRKFERKKKRSSNA